jgi:hypothetical protein
LFEGHGFLEKGLCEPDFTVFFIGIPRLLVNPPIELGPEVVSTVYKIVIGSLETVGYTTGDETMLGKGEGSLKSPYHVDARLNA